MYQTPPPPSQVEETWRAGSRTSSWPGDRSEERPPEPRALSGGRAGGSLAHPLGVAHLARCPGPGRGGGGTGGTALRSNYRGRPGLTPCVCVSRLGPSLRSGSGPSALRPPRGLPQRRRQQQWWRQQQRGGAWRHREQLVHAYPRARNPGAWRCRGPRWTPGGEAAPGRQIENQGTEPTLPAPPPTPRPGVGLPGPAPLPAAPARPPAHPAPEPSARPPRGSCTCPWAAARAPPRVLRSAGEPAACAAAPPRPAPRAGAVGRRPRELPERLRFSFFPPIRCARARA